MITSIPPTISKPKTAYLTRIWEAARDKKWIVAATSRINVKCLDPQTVSVCLRESLCLLHVMPLIALMRVSRVNSSRQQRGKRHVLIRKWGLDLIKAFPQQNAPLSFFLKNWCSAKLAKVFSQRLLCFLRMSLGKMYFTVHSLQRSTDTISLKTPCSGHTK